MRLWHKDLIDVLPKRQLLAQWRECCGIARNIAVNGTPNHILVNKIQDYPIEEFWAYTKMIFNEMQSRGYTCDFYSFVKWFPEDMRRIHDVNVIDIFSKWHTKRYLWQCYSNLEEKYDCGGISDEEWSEIEKRMKEVMPV